MEFVRVDATQALFSDPAILTSAALEFLHPVVDKGSLTLTGNALVFSLPVARDASRDAGRHVGIQAPISRPLLAPEASLGEIVLATSEARRCLSNAGNPCIYYLRRPHRIRPVEGRLLARCRAARILTGGAGDARLGDRVVPVRTVFS